MASNLDSLGKRGHRGSKPHQKAAYNSPAGHSTSINPIKSKIRDVTRLLERSEHLNAAIRIEKERALASFKQDLEQAQREKKKQQMIKKYHMVRFFERKRASKNLKRAKTQLASASTDSHDLADLQKEVHDAEVDVNYAIYHPLTEKYSSLFPRDDIPGNNIDDQTETNKRSAVAVKPPMWKVVEACMENGRLSDLRDGKLQAMYTERPSHEESTAREKQEQKKQSKKVLPPSKMDQNEDEESDGGFFER